MVIFYAGTINSTPDLKTVLEVAIALEGKCRTLKFVFCGGGPLKDSYQREFGHLPNVIFTGWVSHEMLHTLAGYAIASLIKTTCLESYTLDISLSLYPNLLR